MVKMAKRVKREEREKMVKRMDLFEELYILHIHTCMYMYVQVYRDPVILCRVKMYTEPSTSHYYLCSCTCMYVRTIVVHHTVGSCRHESIISTCKILISQYFTFFPRLHCCWEFSFSSSFCSSSSSCSLVWFPSRRPTRNKRPRPNARLARILQTTIRSTNPQSTPTRDRRR